MCHQPQFSLDTLSASWVMMMSSFKNLFWPVLFVFRLTSVLPLTSQFVPSRWGQIATSIVIILSVTLGCIRPYQFIMRSNLKPNDFMNIIGVLLTTFSSVASFFIINFRIEKICKVLTKLELVHDFLNVGLNIRLIISVWLPFSALYVIPMLYKIVYHLSKFNSFSGLVIGACNIARANYLNSSVLTFIVLCHIMNKYFEEIIKQLQNIKLTSVLKIKQLEKIKECHRNLYESAEGLKTMYGIHILLGLVTSNLYFQMSVFRSLQKLLTTNDIWLASRKILQTFMFMSVDIGRIILCFTSSNSIYKQVKNKIFYIYSITSLLKQSQRLRDVLCKSINEEENFKTRDLVSASVVHSFKFNLFHSSCIDLPSTRRTAK